MNAASILASFLGASMVLATPAFAQTAGAPAQHAHVHGTAKLGVAVQDKVVSISLESPLDSLIGFEHRPTTPAQQAAVKELQAKLKDATSLFSFDAGAQCRLSKSEAESAVFKPAPAGGAKEEHADLDASFEFTCVHPERLSTLTIGLFKAYPKLRRLDAEIAAAKGQFKRELRSPQASLSLTR